MIKVLTSWGDVISSIKKLQQDQCFHSDPLKNWDLSQIGEILDLMPRSTKILDAGCSENQCSVLRYLRKKGFYDLTGMDLYISIEDRIQQLLPMLKEKRLKPPFRLFKGDITKTKFRDRSYDAIICLSVIEHGVDLKAFLKEMNRLLRLNGVLYISTDYWPEKVKTDETKPWGLNWSIFSRQEIINILKIAGEMGLTIQGHEIPETGEPVVRWSAKEYTFLSMLFRKE